MTGLLRAFPPTRHSAVEAARSGDPAERERGLQAVAEAYWRPVYGYLRLHWRRGHEEAADLTQDFFAQLIEKELLAAFDPGKARLRTWLRVCVDGLVGNQHRTALRKKRTFDFEAARAELQPAATPEAAFDREWARAVFSLALQQLKARCEREGFGQHYRLLEAYDLGERPSYAALAEQSGIAVTDVTNRLAWARRELRAEVLNVLRELTCSEAELREELRAVLDP